MSAAQQPQSGTLTARASIEINAEPALVWDALTKPEKIKQYFFDTDVHTDWKPGSKITWTGVHEGVEYNDKGHVLVNEPEQLLQYTYWSSMSGLADKPQNYVTVTYRLLGKGASTLVEIEQDNVADTKMRKHSEENWGTVLQLLKEYVEGGLEHTT